MLAVGLRLEEQAVAVELACDACECLSRAIEFPIDEEIQPRGL